MMAFIGWLACVIVGLYFTVAGLFGWIVGGFWSSHTKTAGFLIFTVIGCLLLWYAWGNAPFTITARAV
jgi:hypothetical protein